MHNTECSDIQPEGGAIMNTKLLFTSRPLDGVARCMLNTSTKRKVKRPHRLNQRKKTKSPC